MIMTLYVPEAEICTYSTNSLGEVYKELISKNTAEKTAFLIMKSSYR